MNPTKNYPSFRTLDEANFDSEVLQSGNDFLVVFWAPWSKPCQILDPVLEEVAQGCAGRTEVVKVDTDNNPRLSLWFGVQNIPTLIYFRAGKISGLLVGTVSAEAIQTLLSKDDRGNRGNPSPEKGGAK